MLTKALLGCALLLAAAALAVWLIGRSFGGSHSDERARAIADGARLLSATGVGHPSYHVAGAFRVAPGVWRVEIKESLPRGVRRTPKYACITIQLDRFFVSDFVRKNGQASGTVRGVTPIVPLVCQQP